MNRREFFATSFAGLSAVQLSGCSNKTESESKHIRMGVSSQVRMLDPRKATDALSSRVNRLIYRSLIDFDERFLPVPDLADWESLSDTRIRFTLREQPNFHNGEVLTSKDVIATYESVLAKEFGSPHRASLKNIKSFEYLSDAQFLVHLKEPDAVFVSRLVIGILPSALIKQNHPFYLNPIGCGALKFASVSEQKLVLSRIYDDYLISFIQVKDPTVRLLKLLKGEIDLVQNDLSPEMLVYASKQAELHISSANGTNYGYLGFNHQDALLSQFPMRAAIAHAINRQEIIDKLFAGKARLASGLLVPEHWAGIENAGYEFDLNKAKTYLKQVKFTHNQNVDGESSQQIQLTFKTSNDPTRIRLATIYQSQLRKIGIDLKIQSYDWGTFYSDIKQGRFQLYSLAWVGIKSPDIFQYVFDSAAVPPSGANRGRFADEEVDALIATALKSQSLTEQTNLYQQLQQRLHQQLADMPLWYESNYAVMRKDLTNYKMFSDGRLDGLLKAVKP